MKITEEHYNQLDIAVKRILAIRGMSAKDTLNLYHKENLSDMRCRWDVFHTAQTFFQAENWLVSINTLYTYLNDDHIDTALRKIIAKLL